MKELLKRAKALGIEDPESLSSADLKAEVERLEALKAQVNDNQDTKQSIPETKQDPETDNTTESTETKLEENNQDTETTNPEVKNSTNETQDSENSNPTPETTEAPKVSVKSWSDEAGQVWGFTNNAPKTINWGGRTYTQAQLLKNKNIMEQLTTGSYMFIKRIK